MDAAVQLDTIRDEGVETNMKRVSSGNSAEWTRLQAPSSQPAANSSSLRQLEAPAYPSSRLTRPNMDMMSCKILVPDLLLALDIFAVRRCVELVSSESCQLS